MDKIRTQASMLHTQYSTHCSYRQITPDEHGACMRVYQKSIAFIKAP